MQVLSYLALIKISFYSDIKYIYKLKKLHDEKKSILFKEK